MHFTHRFSKFALSITLSSVVGLSCLAPQNAQAIDMLRNVPLDISSYSQSAEFPSTFTSAEEVLNILNGKRTLLLHMEALRRANSDLAPAQKQELIQKLHDRHRALHEDAVRYFDYGYAQLVINNNKTGLFFLRKANDAIKSQFSSLAYAMAEAEAEINLENGNGAEMTTRKMNVMYNLRDAVKKDADHPRKGFWPTLVRTIESLKALPAYEEVTTTDMSLQYVPYGSSALPQSTFSVANHLDDGRIDPTEGTMLCGGDVYHPIETETLLNEKHVSLRGDDVPYHVSFYKSGLDDAGRERFRVVVADAKDHLIKQFFSYQAPYIIEDIEGDGEFEFVLRQYDESPMEPIEVYRMTGTCSLEKDTDIVEYFK